MRISGSNGRPIRRQFSGFQRFAPGVWCKKKGISWWCFMVIFCRETTIDSWKPRGFKPRKMISTNGGVSFSHHFAVVSSRLQFPGFPTETVRVFTPSFAISAHPTKMGGPAEQRSFPTTCSGSPREIWPTSGVKKSHPKWVCFSQQWKMFRWGAEGSYSVGKSYLNSPTVLMMLQFHLRTCQLHVNRLICAYHPEVDIPFWSL